MHRISMKFHHLNQPDLIKNLRNLQIEHIDMIHEEKDHLDNLALRLKILLIILLND